MSLQPVIANNKDLFLSRYHSNLQVDYAASVSELKLHSTSQFGINQIVLIGEGGTEGSEIKKTHSSTAPSGNDITLLTSTSKPHQKGTPVYILAFDQIEFSYSATLNGAKSVLVLSDIDPEEDEMTYEDTVHTDGYYFTRYKNSITGNFSDYSDGVPYSGLPTNTVGYAIDTAMNELHKKFSENLTFDMTLGFARQMLKLVRGKRKSWSKYRVFDEVLGTMSQGVNKWICPDSMYDKSNNRSTIAIRIGKDLPLRPIDKEEYIKKMEGVVYTEVATEGSVGATSLVLSDTSDLNDDGTIDVYVSGTSYRITYTGNTRSSNTLTGIPASGDGSITSTLAVGSQVWQGINESDAEYFSVFDGYVHIPSIVTSRHSGRNIFIDYYTDIETINSQTDVIMGTKFDMLIPYLKFKIRAVTDNDGKEDLKDPSYAEFRELLNDAIMNDGDGEVYEFTPAARTTRLIRDNDLRR